MIVAVCEFPLSVAVMDALLLLVIVPAVAVKFAVMEFAGTATEAGTVSSVLFDDSDTVVLPFAAEFDKVTVQALVAPDVNVGGEHWTDDRLTGACKLMVAVEVEPLSVAVMVALPLLEIVPAVAAKVAEVELTGTETDAGTVRDALLDDSATDVAVLKEALDSVTVHVLVALEARVLGVH
jgi:hypothetical protein